MTSSWVLCAFFVAITYLLKTSTLRVRTKQDGKLLIFNQKSNDPSAIPRRSLGDPFLFHNSPLFTIPINPTIAFTRSHIHTFN